MSDHRDDPETLEWQDFLPPGINIDPKWGVQQIRERIDVLEADLEKLQGETERSDFVAAIAAAEKRLEEARTRRKEFEEKLRPLNEAHAMRQALLTNPSLVAFIQGDLTWLRLILMTYGGLADVQLAAYVNQYQEIARILSLSDPIRESFVNGLRNRPYWRQSWEGDDVVYNLAVFLDKEGESESKKAKKVSLEFEPDFICLDSVLTPFLLEKLNARVDGRSLVAPLLSMARDQQNSILAASATLALLAVDPASTYDEIGELSKAPLRQLAARDFLNLLHQRLELFGDGVVIFNELAMTEKDLSSLADVLSPHRWDDILSVYYQSLCSALSGTPAAYEIDWLGNRHANAEIWGTWLTSGNGADGKYNLAVVLDTIGKRISSADGVANLHLSHTARFEQFSNLKIDDIPPVWTERSDMFGEALTVAQDSSSVVLEEMLPISIILHSGIDLKENEDLRLEAIAATLKLDEKSFRAVMETLAPELSEKSHQEIEEHVLERAFNMSDPVIQARTLWRVFRGGGYWGEFDLLNEAIAAAMQLKAGLHQARAIECLARDLPQRLRQPLLEAIRNSIKAIPDANNRVRALCRLAQLSTSDSAAPLFQEAVKQLATITNSVERIETLLLMRKVLADNQQPVEGLDEIAETETETWDRHKGMGLMSFELCRLHDMLDNPSRSTPLILHALLSDVTHLLDRNQDSKDAWWQLTKPETRDTAFEALLTEIAASDVGMLSFSHTVLLALNAVADDGREDIAAELLPHLSLPRTRTLPELHEWVNQSDRTGFATFAGLMISENEKLDAQTVRHVLHLLEYGSDIARYRAALVLHGEQVYIGKPNPRHLASVIGLEGILQLSEFAIRMREQGRLGGSNTAAWTWMNVVFDDPRLLEELVTVIEQDEARQTAADWVLTSLYNQNEACQRKFVELLMQHRSGLAAMSFLAGLCTMSHKELNFAVPDSMVNDVHRYLESLTEELIESFRGLPDRIENVKEVIAACTDATNGDIDPSVPNAALHARSIVFPEASPEQIGRCSTYRLTDDPPKALKAAMEIAKVPARLRNLFLWLRATLAESINNPLKYYRVRDTLLEIGAYCGQEAPATVINLLEELELEELLIDAAIHQFLHNGRAGAITLLGYLRSPGMGFLTALRSALSDAAEIQQAALAMVQRLRYVNPIFLSELTTWLFLSEMTTSIKGDDTTLAYAASRMLAVMARHEKTSDEDRKNILRALSAASKDRKSHRTVYAFESSGGNMSIHKLGTLAQRHYQSLMDIVSIA